jgi:hypothetical protein
LQQVFTFLPGNRLFLGAVCKEWEAVYAGIEAKAQALYRNNKMAVCGPKTTLYSAAVASPATARLAHSSGLAISDSKQLQLTAGLLADIQAIGALRELSMPLSERLVEGAALSGRLNILQRLLAEKRCPKPFQLSGFAARSGSISMLKWLKTKKWCHFTKCTCAAAAEAGHLAALRYLHSESRSWDAKYIANCAASSGSIEVVDWLRLQQGFQMSADMVSWAAGSGQIAMITHLRSLGCEWDEYACTQAVPRGRLDTLRWLREQGCPWFADAICFEAAALGRTDTLDYIIEQGEVLSAAVLTQALNTAAMDSRLQAAQWLKQHGAQWPAELGNDNYDQWSGEVLAWARANGCTSPLS